MSCGWGRAYCLAISAGVSGVCPIGKHVAAAEPQWTERSAYSLGRDPLGMQATSVRIYRSLVPGLTNVTNRLRYYSFYCWAMDLWARRRARGQRKAMARTSSVALKPFTPLRATLPIQVIAMVWRVGDSGRREAVNTERHRRTGPHPARRSSDARPVPRGGVRKLRRFYQVSILDNRMLAPSKGCRSSAATSDESRPKLRRFGEAAVNMAAEAIFSGTFARLI